MSPPVDDRAPKLELSRTGAVLAILGRHLWPKGEPGLRCRVVVALVLLVLAKVANVYVPILYKHAVDALGDRTAQAVAVPVVLILGLRLLARAGPGARRGARRGVRAGVPAGDPQSRARGLPPSACAVPALPSRAPDRRAEPRHRARHAGHGVPDPLHDLQHPADPARDRAGRRHPVEPLRLALRRRDARHHRRLHPVLGRAVGMAHQVRAPHERCRHRGQRQGDRQPAQLRDGQVFRQRGARGAPLRRRAAALRDGGHPLQPHAVAAQHRPGRHHLDRPGRR